MKKKAVVNDTSVCQVRIQAISDTMSVLSGKWKFHIIGTLIEGNKLGFMDLLREVNGLGTKMLSKELQDLEMNTVKRFHLLLMSWQNGELDIDNQLLIRKVSDFWIFRLQVMDCCFLKR